MAPKHEVTRKCSAHPDEDWVTQAHLDEACVQHTDLLLNPRETNSSLWKIELSTSGSLLFSFFMKDSQPCNTQAFPVDRHRPWSLLCPSPSGDLNLPAHPVLLCVSQSSECNPHYHQDGIRYKRGFPNDRHCDFHSLNQGVGLRSLRAARHKGRGNTDFLPLIP